jgi:hypothetical protein
MRTADTLYGLMAAAGLQVLASEKELTGQAFGTAFAGRVDLVLGEPARILDLKWSGAGRKRRALKDGTALQLAAYAFLQRQGDEPFPPVGYFVMEAQRLLTTQPDAFHDAEEVKGPPPEETWRLLEATHALEWRTVAQGRLAARGVAGDDGEEPPRESCVEDGRLVVPPACEWCDYAALCGLAFAEET